MEWHAYAESFPLMEGEAFEEFKADLKENGQHQSIKYRMVNGAKQGLDGRNRERALTAIGVEPSYEKVFISDRDVVGYIKSLNLHRRHLTDDQQDEKRGKRRERVIEARQAGDSLRVIAEREQVSHLTVARDLVVATVTGVTVEPENGRIIGKDAKERPATMPVKPVKTLEEIDAEEEAQAVQNYLKLTQPQPEETPAEEKAQRFDLRN